MKNLYCVLLITGLIVLGPIISFSADTPVTDSNMIYSAWVASHEFIASDMPDSGFICWSSLSPYSDYAGVCPAGRAGFDLWSLDNGNYLARGYALRDASVDGYFAYGCEMTYDTVWNLVSLAAGQAGSWIGGNRDACDCNPDRGFISDTSNTILVPGWHASIQSAINCATDGDTVLVGPGTYYEILNLNDRNIVLASHYLVTEDTAFIVSTIIDGDSAGAVITINSGQDSTSKVSGFTIRNGFGASYTGSGVACGGNSAPIIEHNIIEDNQGGGIVAYNANPHIQYNIIRNNVSGEGGGIYCYVTSATIRNNLIVGNQASGGQGHGGGIFYYSSSTCAVENNTIVNNSAINGGGGIYYWSSGSASIMNNIIWGNTGEQIAVASVSPLVTYCDVEGSWPGTGNIASDPLFINPGVDDFRLQSTSPCVNAGNPDPVFNDPDGSRNDMGALPLNPVNRKPVLAVIAPQSVNEGQTLTFGVTATDQDGTIPALTAINLPTNATFADSANGAGAFTFTPDNTQAGNYNVSFIASDGSLADTQVVAITVSDGMDINDGHQFLPVSFALSQNYPNPFNPVTTVSFSLPEATQVTLEVFNIMGQKVATLVNGPMKAGEHQIQWDGRIEGGTPVSTGIYFYRVQAGDFVDSRKMILLK